MQNIVILGTGGNCVDILDTILDINAAASEPRLQCIGFLDDDRDKHSRHVCGVPVIGKLERARSISDALFVSGIGSPQNFWRKPEIIAATNLSDDQFISIIHPSAQVSTFASIGVGTVILQNSVIASNAKIGKHVMILPLSVVSHDSVIGDYSTIAGGVCLSGNVRAGRACYFGSRCAVKENLTIGDYVLCGIGSNVLTNVPSNSVMVGNPARKLRAAKNG